MGRIYTALLAKFFNCRENILFSVEEDASQSNSLSIVMVDNSLRREWRELTRTFPSEATSGPRGWANPARAPER